MFKNPLYDLFVYKNIHDISLPHSFFVPLHSHRITNRKIMYTLSYPLLLAFEVFAFIVFIVTMYFFKSPWRKWICFGAAFITILLLLDAEPTLFANDAYSSEWHWFRFVAFIGVMMIAGIGFLDLRKPNQNRELEDAVANGAEESSLAEDPLKHSGKQTEEVNEGEVNVSSSADTAAMNLSDMEASTIESPDEVSTSGVISDVDSSTDMPSANVPPDVDDEVHCEEDQEIQVGHEAPTQIQQDFEDKVLPWFYDQISQFTPAQQEAIKACVEKFLRNGYISGPKETISRVGSPYTQQKLYEIVSAFMLLDKSREQCADFAKEVFADFFWNTETKTIERKLKGRDKIQLIIDTYWEAKSIKLSRV